MLHLDMILIMVLNVTSGYNTDPDIILIRVLNVTSLYSTDPGPQCYIWI